MRKAKGNINYSNTKTTKTLKGKYRGGEDYEGRRGVRPGRSLCREVAKKNGGFK